MSNYFDQIDDLDRRLIRELDHNARASFVNLGKKLNLPKETVRYRVHSLFNHSVITFSYAVIDLGKLGGGVHKVLLKLYNVNEPKVDQIIAFLVNHSKVNWVARFDGLYDISFTIWIAQMRELSEFVDELKRQFYSYINKIVFAVNIEAEFFPRDAIAGRKRNISSTARYTTPSTPYKADSTDLSILKALAKNPRITATEIGSDLELSAETILTRIRHLEQKKVITGYRVVVDPQAIGEVNYYVFVYLRLVSASQVNQFVQYCRNHPLINYIIKALGEWDYELNVEARDLYEYRSLMMELTREFSEIIRDYYGILVSKIHKFSIMP